MYAPKSDRILSPNSSFAISNTTLRAKDPMFCTLRLFLLSRLNYPFLVSLPTVIQLYFLQIHAYKQPNPIDHEKCLEEYNVDNFLLSMGIYTIIC